MKRVFSIVLLVQIMLNFAFGNANGTGLTISVDTVATGLSVGVRARLSIGRAGAASAARVAAAACTARAGIGVGKALGRTLNKQTGRAATSTIVLIVAGDALSNHMVKTPSHAHSLPQSRSHTTLTHTLTVVSKCIRADIRWRTVCTGTCRRLFESALAWAAPGRGPLRRH